MAWTIDISAGSNWAAPEFIGEFVKAFAERMLAINQTPLPFPRAGAGFAFYSLSGNAYHYNGFPITGYPTPWITGNVNLPPGVISLRAMQDWIETYCVNFADHVNNPGGFAGAATIAPWTLANLRAAAGLDPAGFTRVYYDDDHVLQTAHGPAINGDVVGRWMFSELQAMLNLLVWSFTTELNPYYGGYFHWTSAAMKSGRSPDWEYGRNWDTAKSEAAVNYPTGAVYGNPVYGPFAMAMGGYATAYSGYFAWLLRGSACFTWTKISPLTADATFYLKAATTGYGPPYGSTLDTVFDANGDPVADGVLTVGDSQTITGAGTKTSATIGQTATAPTWCDQPAGTPPTVTPALRGYLCDETAGPTGWLLAKWNVAGGFTFRP